MSSQSKIKLSQSPLAAKEMSSNNRLYYCPSKRRKSQRFWCIGPEKPRKLSGKKINCKQGLIFRKAMAETKWWYPKCGCALKAQLLRRMGEGVNSWGNVLLDPSLWKKRKSEVRKDRLVKLLEKKNKKGKKNRKIPVNKIDTFWSCALKLNCRFHLRMSLKTLLCTLMNLRMHFSTCQTINYLSWFIWIEIAKRVQTCAST